MEYKVGKSMGHHMSAITGAKNKALEKLRKDKKSPGGHAKGKNEAKVENVIEK